MGSKQHHSRRKPHCCDPGYIAERRNPLYQTKNVVIYEAARQGIDVEGKYAVVCDAHATIASETSVARARVSMKHPDNFCEECAKLTNRKGKT